MVVFAYSAGWDPLAFVKELRLAPDSVHKDLDCMGVNCVIHRPSNHHMRSWPAVWRGELRIIERTCPHGVGHPDPDGPKHSHGCDLNEEGRSCCEPEPKNAR